MIKADPRPSEEGRLNTEAKNCLSVSIRAPAGEATREVIHLHQTKATLQRSNFVSEFTKKQIVVALLGKTDYKKAGVRKDRTPAPIDGLEYQTRPSVRGWKSKVFCKPCQSAIHLKWNVDMNRNHNTTKTGGSFSDATIEAVWSKATPIPGRPGYAKDQCGATIYRHSYGAITDLGWEVDHRDPVSNGGSDDLNNLQPLQWQNNRGKGDQYPAWSCTVRS